MFCHGFFLNYPVQYSMSTFNVTFEYFYIWEIFDIFSSNIYFLLFCLYLSSRIPITWMVSLLLLFLILSLVCSVSSPLSCAFWESSSTQRSSLLIHSPSVAIVLSIHFLSSFFQTIVFLILTISYWFLFITFLYLISKNLPFKDSIMLIWYSCTAYSVFSGWSCSVSFFQSCACTLQRS